jgi:demethoxyubiquinone hydroxylase (CLK1/Coq7/Cat5 family)
MEVAVGDAAPNRVLRVDHGGQVDALEQAPNQGQATMAAQIVGQLLDHKIDRICHLFFLHPLGERQMRPKCMICMRIYPDADAQVTDSGLLS